MNAYFEDLAAHLRRQGLPASVRRRLTAELHDHAEDAERTPAEAFGPAEVFADSLVEDYRSRSFLWRHPFLGFGLGPVLLIAGFLTTPVWLGQLVFRFDDHMSQFLWFAIPMTRLEIMHLISTSIMLLNVLAPIIAAILFARWSVRALCPLRYAGLGFGVLTLLGFFLILKCDMIPPITPDRPFSFAYSVGFGFPSPSPLLNAFCAFVPILVFALLCLRLTRNPGSTRGPRIL